MILPDFLIPHKKEAQKMLSRGLVKEIEFSGSTYQIQVVDPETLEECWVFLQLDSENQIQDEFCSYDELPEEDKGGCKHIAAAYMAIFDREGVPHHLRFERSLWNQLCHLYANQKGNDPKQLTELAHGHFVAYSSNKKEIFSLQAKSKESEDYLEEIFFHRPEENEDTSLKFSNLSPEELQQWRQGNPSRHLQYMLSFWYDLARWLFKKQEKQESYKISFKYSASELPNWIQIDFNDLSIGFYLSQANWTTIIPSLATVDSPLTFVKTEQSAIQSVYYDKEKGELHVKRSEAVTKPQGGLEVNGWRFIPNVGFQFDAAYGFKAQEMFEGQALSEILTAQKEVLNSLLTEKVHGESITLIPHLSFDEGWNLHIDYFYKTPGDLSSPRTRLIHNWIYIENEGFFPLHSMEFEHIATVIPIEKVSDFVTRKRSWLSGQEGFQTHVRSMEYQIGFEVTEQNRLIFTRRFEEGSENKNMQDFGVWIYVEGKGFYSKSAGVSSFLLRPGLSINPDQIPIFVKMNTSELELIPGFFCSRSPVADVFLNVELFKNRSIQVTPSYELRKDLKQKRVEHFDDVIYVEDEGFYILPTDLLLPLKYQRMQVIEGDQIEEFLHQELEEIRPFINKLDPKLETPEKMVLTAGRIEAAKDKGRGWYRFNLFYQTPKGSIDLLHLKDSMKKKQRFAFLKEGLIDLDDPRFDWLRRLQRERVQEGVALLTTLEFMRLNAFDPLELDEKSDEGSIACFEELTNFKPPDDPIYGDLVSKLRPYQEIGVKWLWFLYHQQLSGLLCDEMGLGKTHQAMALLSSVRNLFKSFAENIPCHFLVVCPTSVIHHWEEKLRQFLPGIRVCTFYGTKRSLEEFHERYDVLVTSYGIMRNEKELLSSMHFEVAVFDEIQVAKNISSRIYGALTEMQAQMKVGLTGTPIENNIRELKSLMDIVLPTYMPGETEYRELFTKPIERTGDPARKELLNRLIKPFILRRKKSEVLTELPEKIEEVAHCDLSSQQYQLYTEVLEQRRRHLLEELENENNQIPFLHIFSLLTSLKQICDHPAVYLKAPADYHKYHSDKWNLFLELLSEARESGQKVVVFSHFLHMLDIMELEMQKQGIGYASIRGSTKDRKEQINRFNEDPECQVFIGSLQAAGLGIDLTAGSVVIHYDRWWNKAREDQATDRVHRMGQRRGVQVFKLVTKGTFEERIDEMIATKGKLLEEVVGVDDQSILKKFTRSELSQLLSLAKRGNIPDS